MEKVGDVVYAEVNVGTRRELRPVTGLEVTDHEQVPETSAPSAL